MGFLVNWLIFLVCTLFCFAFRGQFYVVEMVVPEAFESLHPVMNGFQILGIEAVKPVLPILQNIHQADSPQDAKMLGDGRLRNSEPQDEIPDRLFPLKG
jgi:hypothetical protein